MGRELTVGYSPSEDDNTFCSLISRHNNSIPEELKFNSALHLDQYILSIISKFRKNPSDDDLAEFLFILTRVRRDYSRFPIYVRYM